MNNNKSFVIALALILALIKLSNGYAITNTNQQNIILNEHNRVRSLAAKGQLRNDGFGQAAKMYPLTWDSQLANNADQWARVCNDRQHNTFGTGNGQNEASGWPHNSAEDAIKALQSSWVNEQSQGPFGSNHFTQMVDDDTLRVGCGLISNCGNNVGWFLVCNYDPAGNNGNAVYVVNGQTGSQCPNGVRSDGLCQGTPQQSGSGSGSGGGSTGGSIQTVNQVPSLNEVCGFSGGGESYRNSGNQCIYTFNCNDGNQKQYAVNGFC